MNNPAEWNVIFVEVSLSKRDKQGLRWWKIIK